MSRWLWTAELWTPAPKGAGSNISQRTGSADRLEERLQLLRPRRMTELPQRLRLDLPDPLPGHVERPADLFQRVFRPVAHAEPHLQDLLLAGGERLQNAARLILEVRDEDGVDRREDLPVLDEVAQMRVL